MPLVLTTRRAGWQRRQPRRSGRERAVSSRGWGGGGEKGGPGAEWPSRSDGFEPGVCASCIQAGQPRVSAHPGPRPGSPPRAPARESRGRGGRAHSPGCRRAAHQRQPRRGSVPGGAPGHGGAARQRAAESRVPGPAAERRSSRPERAGKHLWCREPVEHPDTVPGSSSQRHAAPTISRGLLEPFRSDCPHSLPLPPPPSPRPPPPRAPTQPPPPPSSLPPAGLSLLPSLPSSHSGLLSLAHTFFLTHARRHILPLCTLSLCLPLCLFLFHFCMPCNLLKCCPFPVIRQTPRRCPPRARPLPLSPAFCLSCSRSPPPICYTEAPVNGLH